MMIRFFICRCLHMSVLTFLPPLLAYHVHLVPLQPAARLPPPRYFTCGPRESACWTRGLLPHSDGRCYEPLSRGPCTEGELFLLDDDGAASALAGRCAAQLCARGQLALGNRCVGGAEARARLCAGGSLHLDVEGTPRCGPATSNRLHEVGIICVGKLESPKDTRNSAPVNAVVVPDVPCSRNNGTDCQRNDQALQANVVIGKEDY